MEKCFDLLMLIDLYLSKNDKPVDIISRNELEKLSKKEQELAKIILLRRQGNQTSALQNLKQLQATLLECDKEIYFQSKIQEESLYFELGMLLEAEEVNDEFTNEILFSDTKFINYYLATAFLMKGILLSKRGLQNLAIKQFLVASSFFKFCNRKREVALCYNNIGYSHTLIGDVENSLKYYHQSIVVNNNVDTLDLARTFSNIGLGYWFVNEQQKSINYLNKALSIFKDLNNPIEKSLPLFNLVYVLSHKGNLENAKKYFIELEKLSKNSENSVLLTRALMAKAMLLKFGQSFSELNESINILTNLRQNRFLLPFYQKMIIAFLIEIYLQEMIIFKNSHRLSQIKELISELHILAENEKSHIILINTRIIECEIMLLENNHSGLEDLISETLLITEKYKLLNLYSQLAIYTNNLRTRLEKNINGSISNTLEETNIISLVNNLREDNLRYLTSSLEEPIVFFIISTSGLVIDKLVFSNRFKSNEHLIASFLQAFNLFFGDTLNDSGVIEQITSREYSIYSKQNDELMYVYIVRGQSGNALNKLSRVVNYLTNSKDWVDQIHPNLNKQIHLSDVEIQNVHKIIFSDLS